MAKKYVILNFSDYIQRGSISDRGTPIKSLRDAIQRRVHKKGGTFHIHHLADLLGDLRVERYGQAYPHEVSGLLDRGWILPLSIDAGVYRNDAWSAMVNDCRDADKIIFSAHGHIDDADNVYCEVGMDSIRCGDIEGVCTFLDMILKLVQRTDPTITLVVCYAARSVNHRKNHDDDLERSDIKSSLAFKIFRGLSRTYPQIRLTARTGAVSGGDSPSTSLVSQTEQAIIAAETTDQEFPGNEQEDLMQQALDAYGALDEALTQSNLTKEQQTRLSKQLYDWYNGGYDPGTLDTILNTIDSFNEWQRSVWNWFIYKIGQAADPTWTTTFNTQIQTVKGLAPDRHRLYQLGVIAAQKKAKYGKFIYERLKDQVVVSRWVENSLVQVGFFKG